MKIKHANLLITTAIALSFQVTAGEPAMSGKIDAVVAKKLNTRGEINTKLQDSMDDSSWLFSYDGITALKAGKSEPAVSLLFSEIPSLAAIKDKKFLKVHNGIIYFKNHDETVFSLNPLTKQLKEFIPSEGRKVIAIDFSEDNRQVYLLAGNVNNFEYGTITAFEQQNDQLVVDWQYELNYRPEYMLMDRKNHKMWLFGQYSAQGKIPRGEDSYIDLLAASNSGYQPQKGQSYENDSISDFFSSHYILQDDVMLCSANQLYPNNSEYKSVTCLSPFEIPSSNSSVTNTKIWKTEFPATVIKPNMAFTNMQGKKLIVVGASSMTLFFDAENGEQVFISTSPSGQYYRDMAADPASGNVYRYLASGQQEDENNYRMVKSISVFNPQLRTEEKWVDVTYSPTIPTQWYQPFVSLAATPGRLFWGQVFIDGDKATYADNALLFSMSALDALMPLHNIDGNLIPESERGLPHRISWEVHKDNNRVDAASGHLDIDGSDPMLLDPFRWPMLVSEAINRQGGMLKAGVKQKKGDNIVQGKPEASQYLNWLWLAENKVSEGYNVSLSVDLLQEAPASVWSLNSSDAQQVFTSEEGDDFSKKTIHFTVAREGEKTQEYTFTTREKDRFMAVADIARQVNKAIPDVQLGEKASGDTIMPLASQYRNKIWVKTGANGKPSTSVQWRVE